MTTKSDRERAEEWAARYRLDPFEDSPSGMGFEEATQRGFRDGYLAGLAAARPRWISVSERLPEVEGYYLFLFENGRNKFQDVSWFNPRIKLVESVTHWMPLPAAPETEGG